jgi:tetratricopeptide (TPR) repeat protein
MDLNPWRLWSHDGKPEPGTTEIIETLERAIALDPKHPGANHIYIHAMEASPHPEKATASADLLCDLVPGAGHLVHMPSHIYIRTGRWEDAELVNQHAIEADRVYRASTPDPGFYNIYMAHNHHFLAFTNMMEGREAEALKAARDMVAGMPPEFVKEGAYFADGFMPIVIEVLMRFGKWNEILAEPEPPAYLPVSRAIRRFIRAVALNALGRADEAQVERKAFREAAAATPVDAVVANNPANDIFAIAGHVLDGEIAANQGRLEKAIRDLEEAVRLEDALRYDEPPDWLQPVRHTLGAVYLRAGRFGDAERVYREDLARFPENGWSLFGLGRALRLQKKDGEAAPVEARFRKSWARADVRLGATCLCQPPV